MKHYFWLISFFILSITATPLFAGTGPFFWQYTWVQGNKNIIAPVKIDDIFMGYPGPNTTDFYWDSNGIDFTSEGAFQLQSDALTGTLISSYIIPNQNGILFNDFSLCTVTIEAGADTYPQIGLEVDPVYYASRPFKQTVYRDTFSLLDNNIQGRMLENGRKQFTYTINPCKEGSVFRYELLLHEQHAQQKPLNQIIYSIAFDGDTTEYSEDHWPISAIEYQPDLSSFQKQEQVIPQKQVMYAFNKNQVVEYAGGYQAEWISQSKSPSKDEYFHASPGDTVPFSIIFKNVGEQSWEKSPEGRELSLAVYKDPNVISAPSILGYDNPLHKDFGKSFFKTQTWLSDYRIGSFTENKILSGETGTYNLTFAIPKNCPLGQYREDISLAAGPYWIRNSINGDPLKIAHVWVGFVVE